MEYLIYVALAAHYVTYVVTGSELGRPARSLLSGVPLAGQLVSCYNCFAIWAAAFVLILWHVGGYARYFVIICAVATAVQFVYQFRERTLP